MTPTLGLKNAVWGARLPYSNSFFLAKIAQIPLEPLLSYLGNIKIQSRSQGG